MRIRSLLKKVLDTLMPPVDACVCCGVEKDVVRGLCPHCKEKLRAQKAGKTTAGDYSAYAAYRYDGAARHIVKRYKYGGQKWMSAFIAGEMAEGPDAASASICAHKSTQDVAHFSCVCHVPLHTKRRRRRGYDQAEELAGQLAQMTGVPHVQALRRTRNTKTQTKLNTVQRKENMKGAFQSIAPVCGDVLLVDDVLTTGATACACADELMRAGAHSVFVLTFARALFDDDPAVL